MVKKYVLTGGPGVGKTSVIEEFTGGEIYTIGESAVQVINSQKAQGKNVFPWTNLAGFQKLVVENQVNWEKEIPSDIGKVFIDRGIPDGLAYCMEGKIEPPKELAGAIKKRDYEKVFILDPLPTIENTGVRRENREKQTVLHKLIGNVYKDLGYNPIPVPVLTPKLRMEWILKRI